MAQVLFIGDMAKINISPKDPRVALDMLRYNGKTSVVTSTKNGMYELNGVVSQVNNIPYVFTLDMLIVD